MATSQNKRQNNHKEPTIYRDIKDCDLVIELRDIRLPLSSRVRFLETKFESKARVVFLTKSDLVSPAYKKSVLSWFSRKKQIVYTISSKSGIRQIRAIFQDLTEKYKPKNSLLKVIKLVIVGLPNVGKSTLINCIRGKNVARAANSPGITQGRQWIKISPECYLLDTPGVATLTQTPDMDRKMKFAACRMISDGEYSMEDLGFWLFERIREKGLQFLLAKGEFPKEEDWELFMGEFCQRFSLLVRGGEPDMERGARKFVEFLCDGHLGELDLDGIIKGERNETPKEER